MDMDMVTVTVMVMATVTMMELIRMQKKSQVTRVMELAKLAF
jgi:hypothetical protein